MKKLLLGILVTALAGAAMSAEKPEYSKEIKLSKGKAKFQVWPLPTEASPSGPPQNPRFGIAPTAGASFANYLAKSADDTRRMQVMPLGRVTENSPFMIGFEQMMRSELETEVNALCRKSKLDYLLLIGAPQMGQKTDATAFLFGLGKMRMRNTIKTQVRDCRSKKIVWHKEVLLETSQGMLSAAGGVGAGLFGGPESEQAFAALFTEKLIADLKW